MSPVQPRQQRNPRSLALALGGVLLGVVLILTLFVVAIPKLTESGKIEVKLGSDTFALGNARVKAPLIAQDGPFLFSDPGTGQRDIFVQHIGDDPVKGWSAFDARRPGTTRDCTLLFDNTKKIFTDPCDHTTIPADGAGLPHYVVVISDDDQITVDLKNAAAGTTTTSVASTPSSSILVTR